MCCWKLVERLEKMLVTKAVDSLIPLVGQGPQLWRVLLHVQFILCPQIQNRLVVILLTQQSCSSRQADAALDFFRTEVTEISDTDSLKNLGQIRSDARKKSNLYKWSRECRPNPVSPSRWVDGGMCLLKRCWRSPLCEDICYRTPKSFEMLAFFLHDL